MQGTRDTVLVEGRAPSVRRYGAPAAACAAEILGLLGKTGAPLGAPELARRLNRSKSLVYRVTRELEEAGFVERRSDHRFWLGVGVLELGGAFVAHTDYLGSAKAALRGLADATGDTANVAVLRNADVLYVMKEEGRNAKLTISHVGARVPSNCTALGKALLAELPDAEVKKRLGGRMRDLTPKSIVELPRLLHELATVRDQGYATEHGETIIGRCCIAEVVTIHGLGEAAAISVASSSEGFGQRIAGLAKALAEAKAQIERESAGRGAMGGFDADAASFKTIRKRSQNHT